MRNFNEERFARKTHADTFNGLQHLLHWEISPVCEHHMHSNQLIVSLTVSAHEMPYVLCFCSITGITADLKTHLPNIVTLSAPDNCNASADGKTWTLLILWCKVTSLLLWKGVYSAATPVLKVLKFYGECIKALIWAANSSSLSFTQFPPSALFHFFFFFFLPFDPHFVFMLLLCHISSPPQR